MRRYDCDVCRESINRATDGVLHCEEDCSTHYGDVEGFAFYRWVESAAQDPTMGHVHKRCIGAQVEKYLKRYSFGRLGLPGAHVIITRKKMENRRTHGRKVDQ